MAVSQDTIQKIKALPISSVLEQEGVELRRVGREFITKCLWHDDKNPSLTISDDKGFVFCHACQQHNDVIGFIQKKYGISFRDACEKIAHSHNIQCVFTDENSEDYKQRKLEIDKFKNAVIARQEDFRSALKANPAAIKFIQSREIEPAISREFELGFDPRENRLTIPIHNHLGQLVGFTARGINGDIKPKYKNTENNLIFNKSELVFNEYRAADAIRESDECIFVEGHIDVIKLWQHGFKNVVALQGTASPSQIVLKRLLSKTKRFVLCMDADEGGKNAIAKFLDSVQALTLSGELEVRIASLPAGEDPDSYVSSGADFNGLVVNAPSWMDWLLDSWLNELDFSDTLKIQNVEAQIKALFSRISSSALRSYYYDKASIRLAQNKQSVAAEIAKSFHEQQPQHEVTTSWEKPSTQFTRRLVERRLLRVYLHRPQYRFVIEPLAELLTTPDLIWLWNRIRELQSCTTEELLLDTLKAVIAVAEPLYVQKVRSILTPSFSIEDNESSIAHMEDIMMLQVEHSGIID